MAEILDKAFEDAARTPDLILSGHVHDYQRFTHTIKGKPVPYIVAGNGGYHNLHRLAEGSNAGEEELAKLAVEAVKPVCVEWRDQARSDFLSRWMLMAGGVSCYGACSCTVDPLRCAGERRVSASLSARASARARRVWVEKPPSYASAKVRVMGTA
jgi:hypothetical protein